LVGGQVDDVFVVVSDLVFLLPFRRGLCRRVLLVSVTARSPEGASSNAECYVKAARLA
jgi:hypothetical protein